MTDAESGTHQQKIETTNQSCLSTKDHPAKIRRNQDGKQSITFNERVTVHSVPPYDPSRFSYVPDFTNTEDPNNKPRGCCVIS